MRSLTFSETTFAFGGAAPGEGPERLEDDSGAGSSLSGLNGYMLQDFGGPIAGSFEPDFGLTWTTTGDPSTTGLRGSNGSNTWFLSVMDMSLNLIGLLTRVPGFTSGARAITRGAEGGGSTFELEYQR